MFCSIFAVLSKDKLSLCDKIKGINKEINPTNKRKKKTNVVTDATTFGNFKRVSRKLIIGFPINVKISETIK
jgi:hypothetical protein